MHEDRLTECVVFGDVGELAARRHGRPCRQEHELGDDEGVASGARASPCGAVGRERPGDGDHGVRPEAVLQEVVGSCGAGHDVGGETARGELSPGDFDEVIAPGADRLVGGWVAVADGEGES
jgi:hypothetical protein